MFMRVLSCFALFLIRPWLTAYCFGTWLLALLAHHFLFVVGLGFMCLCSVSRPVCFIFYSFCLSRARGLKIRMLIFMRVLSRFALFLIMQWLPTRCFRTWSLIWFAQRCPSRVLVLCFLCYVSGLICLCLFFARGLQVFGSTPKCVKIALALWLRSSEPSTT